MDVWSSLLANNEDSIRIRPPSEKAGDILVLAGDIGYIGDEMIVVPGNHEFYKYYDIASLQEGELVQIRSNVKVYYNAIVNMGDVDKILSTLWAHIPCRMPLQPSLG